MTIWSNPPSPSADCTLYWLCTADVQAALPLARRWLDQYEAQRAARFVFEEHRNDFLASRLLTRGVLTAYARQPPEQLRFSRSPAGKPALVGAEFAFSLSHSHGVCALLVSGTGRVGVDIECRQTERADISIAEHYFDPREYRWILLGQDAGDRYRRFLSIWTLKEAVLKAEGSGLSLPLDSVAVQLKDDNSVRFLAVPESLRKKNLYGGLISLDTNVLCSWVRTGQGHVAPPTVTRLRLNEMQNQ